MISFNSVYLSLGGKELYSDLNWAIPPGSRFGLIGKNGTGKTTLLRMITGDIFPDKGTIEMSPNMTIGYLPQEFVDLEDLTIMEFLKKRHGIERLEKELRQLEEKIAEGDTSKSTLMAYEKKREEFSIKEGYSFEAKALKILAGLGFTDKDHERSCLEFSGGWKMRILLASLLLEEPQVLLLDEPTNHLDIESTQWVEQHLESFKGTIILISHDRHFLDSVTNKTAELRNGKIKTYSGNYSFYVKEKAKQETMEQKEAIKIERERQQILAFADRFRYKATKASQVQSRLKRLENLVVATTPKEISGPVIKFPECPRSGLNVLKMEKVSKRYGSLSVLEEVDLEIQRGEKIAVVGVNGAGKSTLARLMSGRETPSEGSVNWGHNVKIGFYSQESAANLSSEKTVWEEIRSTPSKASDQERKNLLGAFLFSGEEIDKKISCLSGGEKSRLALLKLLLGEANFIILDEPTNHLDISTREILQDAIKNCRQTVVIISHDRWFLDEIVDRVIEVKDGKCHNYQGNITYFLEKARERKDLIKNTSLNKKTATTIDKATSRAEKKRLEAIRRNELYRKKQSIQKKIDPVEEEITLLESRKDEIDTLLCSEEILSNSSRISSLMVERNEIEQKLSSLYEIWEDLTDKLLQLETSD
ncbi:ABC transporter related protein [Thermovirga lienii DSM 17291]|uniref:ABC transporter related protein n=1 Tax=Thermovirga lienii (strain ATCC BAA-1197 / DSM 17291 / Cas60314) TaxID=580340 RepID=G7V801_THELD|nr:ABC-F family ATP-binding cassette domain-containing protein [Thermovirga lienii]AER66237.1 ABC transporter related protein [Thermovirga lienii DSM 17291]